MAVIGFIGSELLGTAVARRAVAVGHQVVMSNSRDRAGLARAVRRLGSTARAARPGEAALVADLVVLAIPFNGFTRLPEEDLAGRIVLDACNYLPYRDGRELAIEEGRTSTSEVLAERLPHTRVVRGLNTIAAGQIGDDTTPARTPNRRALPIAGDDRAAKAVVPSSSISSASTWSTPGRLSKQAARDSIHERPGNQR
jgi:hypothetical protein